VFSQSAAIITRMEEMRQSLSIIKQTLDLMPQGSPCPSIGSVAARPLSRSIKDGHGIID
jgi:NADH:ubiquinone oxidoreductase subunit D